MRGKRICGRSLSGGPGTCHAWWEGCPAATRHCFQRFVHEQGGQATLAKAQEWERERDVARDPYPVLL